MRLQKEEWSFKCNSNCKPMKLQEQLKFSNQLFCLAMCLLYRCLHGKSWWEIHHHLCCCLLPLLFQDEGTCSGRKESWKGKAVVINPWPVQQTFFAFLARIALHYNYLIRISNSVDQFCSLSLLHTQHHIHVEDCLLTLSPRTERELLRIKPTLICKDLPW